MGANFFLSEIPFQKGGKNNLIVASPENISILFNSLHAG